MIGKSKIFLLLGMVMLVGGFLRFWKLDKYPVSLSIDEVIIGYDAYSVMKTGKDHWGEFLPMAFRSVGDYKPPVMIYMMIPAIKLLGLNEFGIRFMVALISSLTILVVYFLSREIVKNDVISVLTALLLAVSPWHINYSRSTFEAVIALFFVLLSVWVFLIGVKNKGKGWWLAVIGAALAVYAYHAERVFVPVLTVFLLWLYKDEVLKYKQSLIRALVVGVLVFSPFVYLMITPRGQTRAAAVVFTKDYELVTRWKMNAPYFEKQLVGKLVGGYPIHVLSFWLKRYLEYGDLDYLFFSGMRYTHNKYPDVGPILLIGLPFFVLGLIGLMNDKMKFINKRSKQLIWGWLLLGPLPATLANNSQHPLRSLTTLPIPQLITALGFYMVGRWVFKRVRKGFYRGVIISGFIVGLCLNVIYFWQIYSVHFPTHYSHYLMYGMKDIAIYTWQHRKEYKKIVIDPTFGLEARNITGIPFAYVLTFNQIDPDVIQKARQRPGPLQIDNIIFREVDWNKDQSMEDSLLVASKWSFPLESLKSGQVVKIVRLYNGEPMFYLVKTQDK